MRKPIHSVERLIIGLITALMALLSTGVVFATPSSASTIGISQHVGKNTPYGYVGNFVEYVNGHKYFLYCTTPAKALTRGQSLHTVSTGSGLTLAQSRAMEYVLSHWGNTDSSGQAEAVSQSLNTIAGNATSVRNRSRYLTSSVNALTTRFVNEGRSYYGPYKVSSKLNGTPYIGGGSIIATTVMSATGKGVPNATLRLTGTNVSITSGARTNAYGISRVGFRAIGIGTKSIRVTAYGLAPTSMIEGYAGTGQQRLFAAGSSIYRYTYTTYQRTQGGASMSYSCTSWCKGDPDATFTISNPTGAIGEYTILENGLIAKTFQVAAGRSLSTTIVVWDTKSYTMKVRYYLTSKWTAFTMLPGKFVVDCPPIPDVTETMYSNCSTGTKFTVSMGNNTTAHAVELLVNDVVVAMAQPGNVASWSKTIPCYTHATFTYTRGIQRLSQDWNVADKVTISM